MAAELRAYHPGIAERTRNWVADTVLHGIFGMEPRDASTYARERLDYFPIIDAPLGLLQAAEDLQKGNYTSGLLGSAMAAVPVLPAAAKKALSDVPTLGRKELEELSGATYVPTVADLTRAGSNYTGIDASKVDIPEPLLGGPGYPLMPEQQAANLAWAVQGKNVGTKKLGQDADFIAVTAMNPRSHRSNATFANALNKTMEAYARDKRIAPEAVAEIDNMVRAAATTPELKSLRDFPGFASPEADAFLSAGNLSFEARKRVADILASKKAQGMGAPNVERVLQETVDPRFAGARPRDTLMLLEPDKGADLVDLAASGLPEHPSYQYGIPGRVVGLFDQPVGVETMFPDFWDDVAHKAWPQARRSFDLSYPKQELRPDVIEGILGATGYGSHIQSPAQARAATDAILGNWRQTTTPVNQGGLSPQQYADAIRANEAAPSLTQYTGPQLARGARSGDLTGYQLGDQDIYFGLEANPDYSWMGLPEGYGQGKKSIVGVVSNQPGGGGMAAPATVSKAVEEGGTLLDAFAVPNERAPSGFLPEYYGSLGFREIGRTPFSKEYYIGDHGEMAYRDLVDTWQNQGWSPEAGMPDVVAMEWQGSPQEAATFSRRFFGTEGEATGRAAKARNVSKSIGDLTEKQAKNLGITKEEWTQLKDLRKQGLLGLGAAGLGASLFTPEEVEQAPLL